LIFLNIDLAELPDEPVELYSLADLANLACGGHAGDETSIARAVALCRAGGAAIGAHPSYPDREGFGRRRLDLPVAEVARAVGEQCATLRRIAGAVHHVKLHGALYHAADADSVLARAVLDAAVAALGDVAVIGPPGGALAAAAGKLRYLREGFADRGMDESGRLLPRGTPGALITDPAAAAAQALRLADHVDTLCVHGDSPGAVAIAWAVKASLP
jgi:5-oxoprolinase (ATP-hydrolysing) subunit A